MLCVCITSGFMADWVREAIANTGTTEIKKLIDRNSLTARFNCM